MSDFIFLNVSQVSLNLTDRKTKKIVASISSRLNWRPQDVSAEQI